MSKILRIYEEGGETFDDWGKSEKYGSGVIKKIKDPAGLTAKKEITSIPSPFARIDLTKTAFKHVVDSGDLDGDSIYHKIVSDSLDIGEIFFNFDKLTYEDPVTHQNKPMFEIVVWDRENEIEKLRKSNLKEHRILGETLDMYLNQDAKAYNFDELKRFYLLKYNGPEHKEMDIVGATSPATIFFSTANNLNRISKHVNFGGNDRPFDNEFASLHKRDFKFHKYLRALQKSSSVFSSMFPEVDDYLKANYDYLKDAEKEEIDHLDGNAIGAYEELSMNGSVVNVNGLRLHKSPLNNGDIQSDFAIDSKVCEGRKPLVLPVEAGDKYTHLRYVNDNWNKNYHAPYNDSRKLEDRTLPETSERFPYLTLGDFLQTTIVSMPYQLNDKAFFDGNSNDHKQTFLLPLTKRFFEYFSVDDLLGTVKDGAQSKKMFEMKPVGAGSVKITLRIPILNSRVIEYERTYYTADPDDGKSGTVVEKRFGLGVFPLVDFGAMAKVSPSYRLAFFTKSKGDRLEFAKGKAEISAMTHVVRREADKVCSIESYVVENVFDHIVFQCDEVCNVIVPRFTKPSGGSRFVFAIDFGTTNTHIEYSKDDEKRTTPFDILKQDQQMQRMHEDYLEAGDRDIEYAFDDAFVPDTIHADDPYSFPMRTAFAESKKINYSTPTFTLADGNVPFRYGMAAEPLYNKTVTNLKWSNDDKRRIEMYLENLILLIRNKVLLNGGDLQATRIVWFYPASMTRARYDEFKKIWNGLYHRYFGETASNLEIMSESIAPYYYYKQKKGAMSNVVTIDIGGGTTDVFVVEGGLKGDSRQMLSSFRFAANAIFGDGYNFDANENGFVNAFKAEVEKVFDDNGDKEGLADLRNAYNAILGTEKSIDVANFFFSLSDNRFIRDHQIPYNFMDTLARDEDFKYVFIVFYGAILYYVAMMMKAKGYQLPQTLAFSGNGSRTLYALSSDADAIASFATRVFEKVYGTKYTDSSLKVIFDDNPKLATCKGGIVPKEAIKFDAVEEMKTSLLGTDDSTFVADIKYNAIGESNLEEVATQVSQFIDALFEIGSEKSFFANKFNASRKLHSQVLTWCKKDLKEYTKQGLAAKLEELAAWGTGSDTEIEETMYFYPLVAIINRLAFEIFTSKTEKP